MVCEENPLTVLSISLKDLVGGLEPLLKLVKISENQHYCPKSDFSYSLMPALFLLITSLKLHSYPIHSHPFSVPVAYSVFLASKRPLKLQEPFISHLCLFLLFLSLFVWRSLFIPVHSLLVHNETKELGGERRILDFLRVPSISKSPFLLQSYLLDGLTKAINSLALFQWCQLSLLIPPVFVQPSLCFLSRCPLGLRGLPHKNL